MNTFAQRVLEYHFELTPDWTLPEGIDLIYPYTDPETRRAMTVFYHRFYGDNEQRLLAFGINPGRFGAGVTGIPFTSPNHLEADCAIDHQFSPSREVSSAFIYEVVQAYGGPAAFYQEVYISSLCPLGFLRNGKNYNYYDSKALFEAVRDRMIQHIWTQIELGCSRRVALCLGEGQNYRFFQKLNEAHHFFEEILPLAHPRYIMQYKRKSMESYKTRYLQAIEQARTIG